MKEERPGICTNLRVTTPAGSLKEGTPFNNPDFLQPDWKLTKIRIEIAAGLVQAFWLHYDNGLIISRGKTTDGRKVEMSGLAMGERIIAATVHTSIKDQNNTEDARVLSLILYTNRGRSFIGQASKCIDQGKKKQLRDKVVYRDVSIKSFDSPLKEDDLKGFWGRSDENETKGWTAGIWRLGLIWGDINKVCAHMNLYRVVLITTRQDTENAIEKVDVAAMNEFAVEECLRTKRAALWGDKSNAWRNNQVQIYKIIYHGQTITSDEVAKRFLDCATARSTVTHWLPGQFGLDRDPAPGVSNASYIFYRYRDTGRLMVLREGEMGPFAVLRGLA